MPGELSFPPFIIFIGAFRVLFMHFVAIVMSHFHAAYRCMPQAFAKIYKNELFRAVATVNQKDFHVLRTRLPRAAATTTTTK